MSLTSGRGPLSPNRSGWFTGPVPDGVAYVEPFRRRVRGVAGDRTVVDTDAALLVHRPGGPPIWAFPPRDVNAPHAAPVPEAEGYVEIPWSSVDHWFQEEQEVRLHAPNPYHRVDYVPTTRHLRVTVGDDVIVDTTETLGVYETALEPRLYVARSHVRMDRLVPSTTTTVCPYKGTATHWSARVDDETIEDVAWSYPDPLPEAAAIAGMLSFYDERASVETDIPEHRLPRG